MASRLLTEAAKEATRKPTVSRLTVSEGTTYWNTKCRMRPQPASRSAVARLPTSTNMGVRSAGVDAMSATTSAFSPAITVPDTQSSTSHGFTEDSSSPVGPPGSCEDNSSDALAAPLPPSAAAAAAAGGPHSPVSRAPAAVAAAAAPSAATATTWESLSEDELAFITAGSYTLRGQGEQASGVRFTPPGYFAGRCSPAHIAHPTPGPQSRARKQWLRAKNKYLLSE